MRHLAALALAATLAAPVRAVAPGRCVAIEDVATHVPFARYPAAASAHRWRGPEVRRGEAHLFRTVLREGSVGPPNFAGHYTVVEIGCGAGATCPAFVDRTTGRVRFAPGLRVVVELGGRIPAAGRDHQRLTYRRDSRLLVATGMPNEVESDAGVHLYDWHGGRLSLVRFVPAAALCAGGTP